MRHLSERWIATKVCWKNMKARCDNSNRKDFKNYGGRGIKYCGRWDKFLNFIEDMGLQPYDLQLDRIKTNGSYSKSNCRWVSSGVNLRNRRGMSNTGFKFISSKRMGNHIGFSFSLNQSDLKITKYFNSLDKAVKFRNKFFRENKIKFDKSLDKKL